MRQARARRPGLPHTTTMAEEDEDSALLRVLAERISALEAIVTKGEAAQIERLAAALEAHRQLHVAHDASHEHEHVMTATALTRAEVTMKELAALHARAHEREHELSQDAIDKAHDADTVRFEHLNEAKARAQDERVTFATREVLDDRTEALANRIDALDRQTTVITERMGTMLVNAGRIDALEKTGATLQGREHGVALSWGILAGAVALTAAIVALLSRVF